MLPAVALVALLAAAEGSPAEVRIPLSEYEALRREPPSVTVVDTLRLSGSFRGRDLVVTLSGRASGRFDSVPVLTPASAEGVAISGCDGEALVSRAEDGGFVLTPVSSRFVARCRLAAKGSDRLTLTTTRHVLAVESAVADGELVPGAEAGSGERSVSVVRLAGGPKETLEATATGRYRLTLRPGEARFRYALEVRNPNRTRRSFDVVPSAGETVQQVDSEAPWDLEGRRYRFDLPPGDTTLVLSGTLGEGRFAPPVKAAIQYVLLESHPLLRPEVEGNPKRVSPAETGISGQFRGAQAFLLGDTETLVWKATALEAKRTAGYAVSSARHLLFLPASGPLLGESAFGVDNQGAPDLTLPLQPDFTYAALGDEAVFLTKNTEGRLWLPIAQGSQSVLLQHSQKTAGRLGLAWGAFDLPTLPVPASNTSLTLRFPTEWIPLYAAFASESRFFSPGFAGLVAFAFLFLCVERSLWTLGLRGKALRFGVGAALALASLAWGTLAALLVLASAAVGTLAAWPWLRRQRTLVRALSVVAGVFIVGVVALAGISILVTSGTAVAPLASRIDDSSLPSSVATPPPMQSRKLAGGLGRVAEEQAPEKAAADYSGLPARMEIPYGARELHFSGQMLGAAASSRVSVVALSSSVVEWSLTLVALLALALLGLRRRVLGEGLGRLWAAARSVDAGGTSPEVPLA